MKKITTCILIANGTRAHFYFNDGPDHGLKARADLDMEGNNIHARDIQADKPSTTFDRSGGGRHAKEYSSDPQRMLERKFIKDIIECLEGLAKESAFDRLVLVASPHVLGEMRQLLPHSLNDKVYAELNKDLTQIPQHDLPRHFDGVIVL